MKEIDTEISVIWPSWCYSDNIHRNLLKEFSEIDNDLHVNIDRESNYQEIEVTHEQIKSSHLYSKTSFSPLAPLTVASNTIAGKKKMLSERSLLLSGYSNNNIDSVKTNCEKSNTPPLAEVSSAIQGTGVTFTPTTTAAAAAAYLYLEKVKNERMSPRVTAAQLDSLKDAIMESSAAAAVAAAMVNTNNSNPIKNNNSNNNSLIGSSSASNCNSQSISINSNLVNSQVQDQIINNTSDELQSHSLTQSCSQSQQHQLQNQSHQLHQQHQQKQSLHMNSNHVKKERLSPGTNGDLLTSLSRSRSTTPSSFRDMSPQHSSPSESLVPMRNLSTNLLSSIHQAATSNRHGNLSVSSPGITSASSGLPTDFSSCNYSDFMRSLAAKYNNANPNDNLKRNILFEATSNNTISQTKTSTAAQKTSNAPSASNIINKEVSITTTSSLPPPPPLTSTAISPGESALKLSQQNKLATAVANASAACSSNVSPYITSFLSSLPFSPGIFPPLIDMTSTQALIILARAAKENEIHNILRASSQQHTKRSAVSTSPSPSPSLNMALQQAAQFISPTLIYSAQLQNQQLQQQQQQISRQSSPRLANISNATTSNSTFAKSSRNLGEKNHVSPLDLSSQPPTAKRFKAESTSTSRNSTDGLIHTTIKRRASSSTATMSPSPPPRNEKSLDPSTTTADSAATVAAIVGSSTKTEATTTAFTPIKVASSTSATSSIAPAVAVRQCQAQSEELSSWTVDDVCAFVGSIDICAEYVKNFRDQCIDGSGLPLLTEDHLVNSLGMKLGPALKLRSVLAKKLGGPCPCVSCVAQVQQMLALQTGSMTAAAATGTTSDHNAVGIAINVAAIGSSCSNNSGNYTSHLPKNSLPINSSINCSSYNSSNNSSVSKSQSTTATTSSTNNISINSTTTNVFPSIGNTSNTPRNNNDSNINNGSFSLPISQQQPHLLRQDQQQQHSSSQNICSNNNNNTTNNRLDNADSSS